MIPPTTRGTSRPVNNNRHKREESWGMLDLSAHVHGPLEMLMKQKSQRFELNNNLLEAVPPLEDSLTYSDFDGSSNSHATAAQLVPPDQAVQAPTLSRHPKMKRFSANSPPMDIFAYDQTTQQDKISQNRENSWGMLDLSRHHQTGDAVNNNNNRRASISKQSGNINLIKPPAPSAKFHKRETSWGMLDLSKHNTAELMAGRTNKLGARSPSANRSLKQRESSWGGVDLMEMLDCDDFAEEEGWSQREPIQTKNSTSSNNALFAKARQERSKARSKSPSYRVPIRSKSPYRNRVKTMNKKMQQQQQHKSG